MNASGAPVEPGDLDPRDLPGFDDVVAAAGRLQPYVLRTPVLRSAAFDARAGRRVFFKCENLQHGGAFKYRGAMNALLSMPAATRPSQVLTHSSGNHGAALALAGRALGIAVTVVMPEDCASVKIEAVRRAGATIEFCAPGIPAREAALARLLAASPGRVVHPYDDSSVIAGQGTAALELVCETPGLDVVTTPVGGGGLIGGTALAVRGTLARCRVIAAEPAQAADAERSFRSGVRESASVPQTMADGLRGAIGRRNFALLRALVDDVVTVTEQEIAAAMRVVLEDCKLLIEPSSAVAVAAVLAGRIGRPGETLGVLLSGGNVDLAACPFLAGALPQWSS